MKSLHETSLFSWLIAVAGCMIATSVVTSTWQELVNTNALGRRVGVSYRRCHACSFEYPMNDVPHVWTCPRCNATFGED